MEIMQILKANGVPMDGTIDIRSNPVVRQQVMNVVRRAAQQGQGHGSDGATGVRGVAALCGRGPASALGLATPAGIGDLAGHRTISEAEYSAKRQQILAGL